MAEILPLLYLLGLSSKDFVLALAEFFGTQAGLSAAAITRLTRSGSAEREAFMARDLSAVDYVYCWVDGIHFAVRLGEDDRLCVRVMVGVRTDGTKELIGVADEPERPRASFNPQPPGHPLRWRRPWPWCEMRIRPRTRAGSRVPRDITVDRAPAGRRRPVLPGRGPLEHLTSAPSSPGRSRLSDQELSAPHHRVLAYVEMLSRGQQASERGPDILDSRPPHLPIQPNLLPLPR